MEDNQGKQQPKTVEVNREALERLMSDVETLKQENKKLLEVADKGRVAHYETTHKESNPRIYRLSTYNDKVILSWRMVANQVWKDPDGKFREKQEIELAYHDGEKEVVPYVEFVTKTQKISARLLSTTQSGSQVIFDVETDDGRKFTIDSTFIN